MKFEEKIKNKYLYSKGFNFFKLFYFLYQLIKTNKILKEKKFYSNWGVDIMADDFFKKKKHGIFIDVGCHHPFLNNNTNRLYKRGWVGINIDLDFNSIELFNFFRKKDTNIHTAISNKAESKDLFFFHNRSPINTLSPQLGLKAKEVRKIHTQSLNEIIQNTKFKDKKIDYISIDVEGTELDVLMGFDFNKYKPDLVVLEFIDPRIKEFYQQNINNILNSELNKYMNNNDYNFVNWIHDDLVYVPKDLQI